jgi:uncharacterized protein YkwD
MKSILKKLMIVGLLAAGVLPSCTQVAPRPYQAYNPPMVRSPAPVWPPPGVRCLARVEDLVFEMTNQVRRARGLAPLIKDNELREVARSYSDDMLVRRFFDHTTPDGVPFEARIRDHYRHGVDAMGENIWSASGYNPNNAQYLAREIMDSWMRSPGHRENLLSPDFTHLGVGISASYNNIRATQDFVGSSKGFRFSGVFNH